MFPENIHTHPYRRGLTGKSKGKEGMQGPKSKKESVRAMQREGERGRGKGFKFKPLNPPWERYGYFLEQHNENTYFYFRERIRIIGKVANYFNWNI